jgi:hypothetical protein
MENTLLHNNEIAQMLELNPAVFNTAACFVEFMFFSTQDIIFFSYN